MKEKLDTNTKPRHCSNLLLATVVALKKLFTKPFCRPVFIKSVHFNETIANAKFYFVPLDEKYYLSYMERRNHFDFMFGKIRDFEGYNVWRHYYALGLMDNLD